jgi:hypothetical protein
VIATPLRYAAAAAVLCACLVGCADDGGPEGDDAPSSPTCRGDSVDNSSDEAFRIEPVGTGGPHLDRNLWVDLYPESGHLCADIVIDHADTGAEATAYSISATQDGRTWEQSGTDPDDEEPLRVDATGCVDFVATLTVIGAGDEEFDYRAEGRVGIECTK